MPPNRKKRRLAERHAAAAASEAPRATVFGLAWPIFAPIALLCLAILLVVIARVRLLDVPLERDEGEYAYIGQLMLHGVAPYGVAANMKLPGTYAAYAMIMALFGQTTVGIHFGFLLVNAGSIVLVYFLARRLFGFAAGIAAAAAYAVLSVGSNVLGVWAHATQFVVLPALGATLLLLKWEDSQKVRALVFSGLLFGIAFLMKQPGILFALFGALYLVYTQRALWRGHARLVLRNLMLFGAAVVLPFGVTCLLLWRAGVFGRFWFWVFTYAQQYASARPLSLGVAGLLTGAAPIVENNLGIGLLAAVGLFLLWRRREHRLAAVLVTEFLVCSFLAVCPGLYFREHYFVVLLPAVALLAGAVAATAPGTTVRALPLWIVAAALAYSFCQQGRYLFLMTPAEASHLAFGSNPFPEAVPVASYIRAHTNAGDRILVLGSEPEIYFYSGRRSVTPYVYVYSMMEAHRFASRMQAEFIHDAEAGRAKYVVFVNTPTSWLIQTGAPTGLLRWATPYCQQHYDIAGVIEVYPNRTVYHWDAGAANYRPKSPEYLVVFRRKGE